MIRVPLAAMIEVDFPTRGPGYLDLSRADEALRSATTLYLINNIAVYENNIPLPAPRIVQARVSLPSDRSFTSYEQARAHLGPWTGPSAITFGCEGEPTYVEGPYDNPSHVLRTLRRAVGRNGFHYTVALDLDGLRMTG